MHGQSEPRAARSRVREGSRREAEAQDNQDTDKIRDTRSKWGEVDSPGKILAGTGLRGPGKNLAEATCPMLTERATLEPTGLQLNQPHWN